MLSYMWSLAAPGYVWMMDEMKGSTMPHPQRSLTPRATSDVAQLLQRIDDENRAARDALSGLASGTARHAIISAHMAHAQEAAAQLIDVLGRNQAMPLIIAAIDQHS
jgi:uncharacterized membrane protein